LFGSDDYFWRAIVRGCSSITDGNVLHLDRRNAIELLGLKTSRKPQEKREQKIRQLRERLGWLNTENAASDTGRFWVTRPWVKGGCKATVQPGHHEAGHVRET